MISKILILVLFTIFACTKPTKREFLLNPQHEEWSVKSPDNYSVEFSTSQGNFVIDITRKWAPIGADRFYNLVRHGYYDDARFHRVVKGFIVQFGLAGDPTVTQAWMDQFIPDDPVKQSNRKGTIAYAFTEPGTRSTQVYINMVDNVRLDSIGFAPFGKVIKGMNIVERIFSGYGEDSGGGVRRGDQSKIVQYGNEYLDREFPDLDRIMSAKIVE